MLQLNNMMNRYVRVLLPTGSKRRRAAGKLYRSLKSFKKPSTSITYRQWIKRCEPLTWIDSSTPFPVQPHISIVVPTYNTPDKYLVPLIASVTSQRYQNWQLCLADGSTVEERARAIKDISLQDKRIVYKRLAKNYGIVGNTNEAIKMAEGEFVAFLDHDDSLSPHALAEVVYALGERRDADVFYSDEDKLSEDGKSRLLPFFKPGWSPTLEECVNYMTHFLVVRRSVLRKVGLREGFDGAQDYDLILRLTELTQSIVHIPKVLYHWRMADGSTSGSIDNKKYADHAGRRALADHIKRQGIMAEVLEMPELPTNYRLRYVVPSKAKVSIIIPFKDKVELLKTAVGSILEKTTYKNYEVILLSNNSVEPETEAYLQSLKGNAKIKVFYWDHPYNFSALNNFGRKQASGDYLVLLNNDTEVISGDWLEELIGVASQPGAGAVGPLLLYPNDKIQHAGIVLGMNTMAGHVFRHLRDDALTAFGRPYWPRNYLAVTGACLAIKASKYDEAGGLDEHLVMAGNDVALGIRLFEKGYKNVYWPFVRLYHHESVSVGSYSKAPPTDYDRSLTYYRPYLNWQDPYFNVNLDIMNEQVGLRSDYEKAR